MIREFNVFSTPERLNLTPTQRKLWLTPLIQFLHENSTRVGDVLLENSKGRWSKRDVRQLEKLILAKIDDSNAIREYLSILHEVAHHWSVTARVKVKLPRFLAPSPKRDNPFTFDYATAVARYFAWKDRLGDWLETLFPPARPSYVEDRSLLLGAFLVSAIVYGGVLGVPFLVAIVRAIANTRRATFAIGGRIHIDLSLSAKGVADAERRIWLPDAVSAGLWDKLIASDIGDLLAPAVNDGVLRPPNDGEIYRRVGRLLKQILKGTDQRQLSGIQNLRRCTLEVALSQLKPVLVAYGNSQFISNSLLRGDTQRLFPNDVLFECEAASNPQQGLQLRPDQPIPDRIELPDRSWCSTLLGAANSESPRESLTRLAADALSARPLRQVADFGVSLLSSTAGSGKPMSKENVAKAVALVARSLGAFLDSQDLAALGPVERRAIYLEAINRQPAAMRRESLSAILEFDLYFVAQNPSAYPVPRCSLPWLPKSSCVDANLVTHREYFEILRRIDAELPAENSQARREIARLVVIIAFRCGLRRSEIRRLRMADLLIRASGNPSMRHLLEILIRPRKGDPLKTPNAVRRICIGALLTRDELKELRSWFDRRIRQEASLHEYLFAIPEEKLLRLPKSFFQQLNTFLRNVTKHTNFGNGIHLHHLRHAAHSWLFVSLMSSDLESPLIMFPDLKETKVWLAEGKAIRQLLNGHSSPTRKDPFMLACLAGHGSFDVTAGNYIHLFPWLMAAFLDRSESMVPDEVQVRRASGVPDATFRRWLREGGIHSIPLKLFKKSGTTICLLTHRSADPLDKHAHGFETDFANDWLNPAWNSLLRFCKQEADPVPTPEIEGMLRRAKILRDVERSNSDFRHPMESWVPEKRNPSDKRRLACPQKPPQARNIVRSELLSSISTVRREDPELLRDALNLCAAHLEEGSYLRFDSVEEVAKANRYIEFLRMLGLGKRGIKIVSGDPDSDSSFRKDWRDRLYETNMLIMPCGGSRNFGSKSSLSIRPSPDQHGGVGTGPAGFRFAMAMAFIMFGDISEQLAARSV